MRVLLNDGNGQFGNEFDLGISGDEGRWTLSDMNNDGFIDVVTTYHPGIFYSDGDNTIDETLVPFSLPAVSVRQILDLNGDDRLDLVVLPRGTSGPIVAHLFEQQDDNSFIKRSQITFPGPHPSQARITDVNGDDLLDFLITDGEIAYYPGNDDFSFDTQQRITLVENAGIMRSNLQAVDLNNDGAIDLISQHDIGQLQNDGVRVYLGYGDLKFVDPIEVVIGNGAGNYLLGDVNEDGLQDIIHADGGVNVFLANPLASNISGGKQYTYDADFAQLTHFQNESFSHQTVFEVDPINGNTLSETILPALTRQGNQPGPFNDVVTTFTYTPSGQIDTVTDPLGRIMDYDYDPLGRLERVTSAVGTDDEGIQQFEYDAAGNVTASIDENNNRTEYQYDAMNRLRLIIQPDPDGLEPALQAPVTEYRYDEEGNVREFIDARTNPTLNTYDARNRLIQMADALGQVTTIRYDNNDNTLQTIDPLGNAVRNFYDARDRLVATIDQDGGRTRFGYDVDNNLVTLVDPVDNLTRYSYDARDRQVRETDPLRNSIYYRYDDFDNLIEKTDRNERVTELAYDHLDRLVKETWKDVDSSVTNTITTTYDDVGNLLALQDDFSELTYTYDARNRFLTSDNVGTPNAPHVLLTYTYDAVGNTTSVTDTIEGVVGATTEYLYDPLNRQTRVSQSGNDVSDKRVDFLYNEIGQYIFIERYSDLDANNLVARTNYFHDELNRVDRINHSDAVDAALAFFDYEYDAASRIRQIEDVNGVVDYSYDRQGQLTGAAYSDMQRVDETYGYDENGNRVNSHLHSDGYETGNANRLDSDGTYSYEYDDEGNLIRRTELASGDYREFAWDNRNRLLEVIDRDSQDDVIQQVSFVYDAMGRRLAKSVVTEAGQNSLHFVYNREDVLLEFENSDGDGSNSPQLSTRNFHGPGIDQVIAQEFLAGETRWLLTDHLGTIRYHVGVDGRILAEIDYDSFGGLVDEAALGKSRYAFTGREWDVEIELQFNRARYFDGTVGLWLSEDPIGYEAGDANFRRYVQNSPVGSEDAFGLMSPREATGMVSAGIGVVTALVSAPVIASIGAGLGVAAAGVDYIDPYTTPYIVPALNQLPHVIDTLRRHGAAGLNQLPCLIGDYKRGQDYLATNADPFFCPSGESLRTCGGRFWEWVADNSRRFRHVVGSYQRQRAMVAIAQYYRKERMVPCTAFGRL